MARPLLDESTIAGLASVRVGDMEHYLRTFCRIQNLITFGKPLMLNQWTNQGGDPATSSFVICLNGDSPIECYVEFEIMDQNNSLSIKIKNCKQEWLMEWNEHYDKVGTIGLPINVVIQKAIDEKLILCLRQLAAKCESFTFRGSNIVFTFISDGANLMSIDLEDITHPNLSIIHGLITYSLETKATKILSPINRLLIPAGSEEPGEIVLEGHPEAILSCNAAAPMTVRSHSFSGPVGLQECLQAVMNSGP
ncbi:hypothetical protein GNI_091800 [Gregarina niphandrodes]|uniref:Uncharacterized protein n=1 Tax=Gregarina niphandrodes TaxID=110365 RepID=A0A023B5C3_GRENI|nr:hypothetical protein GNI_091800 [Gregarina niphandrodes]EZG59763.1 hypothetical protein GNI_091800 [Gregarina niphandrodes]|eukprot:XP_011130877.1 hypothetical protein GNI_091800 [Gregarina niphandrodes]